MDNQLEQAIDQVLDILSDEKSSNKLVETIRKKYQEVFDYLKTEYDSEFDQLEFDHLEYGVFLICAVLHKQSNDSEINMDQFLATEEKLFKYIEDNKSIQPYFTNISLMDPKMPIYNLIEEYYHTLEEEGVSGISRNIIGSVMSALL